MALALKDITPENYEQVLALSVRPDQERFVAPVVKSLAEAYVFKAAIALAAYSGAAPVGFALIYPYEEGGRPLVNIVRLLIDAKAQGRGYGRELLTCVLERIETLKPRPAAVRISTYPDNEPALSLYRSAGFAVDGKEDGETVLWKSL